MKKHFNWFAMIFIIASMIFMGCQQEASVDTTAPADVTNLVATNIATSVLLEWKDAQDADIFGYEVSWDKTIPVNRSVSMEANTMMIAPKTQGCYVSNLEIGESYTFTVKSVDLSGNKSAGQTATIIYTPNDAEISLESISIPDAGESYAGQILPVVIKGNNFKSPYFEVDTLEAEGVKKFQVISNTLIQAEIECPTTAENYTVEVKCGKLSKSTTYRVIEAEKCFNVGDILFTDGTRIKAENVKYGVPNTQVEKAFGVVASAPYGGATGKVVGLQMSSESLPWAKSETTGYYTNFTEIQLNDYYEIIDGKGYYTFTGDLDGSDNWEEIKKADPEGTDTPEEIATNYPAFNYALNYGASLEETDYADGWYIPSAAELYDIYTNIEVVNTSLTEVGDSSIPTSCWSSSQCANKNNSAYYGSGSLSSKSTTRKVLVIQSIDGDRFTEYVYPEPSITSVTIQTAGEGYTGELPVTIIGENLKGHAITCSDASFGNVKYVSDTKVTATITCDDIASKTSITVTIGKAEKTGTVEVFARDKCFNVGDILFTDGTRIKAENVKYGIPDTQYEKAFGVVASAPYGGVTGKVLGLQKSSSRLKWAPDGTKGYTTNFTEIQAAYTGSSSSGYTFTGDLDGSDNWEYICSIDPEGTDTPEEIATNYPAFDYALNYGKTAGLTGTKYETGWYIPSVAELYDVYTNKEEEVQTSLTAVGGFTIDENYCLSSSQSDNINEYMYQVRLDNGSVFKYFKSTGYYVLVVQAFNAELFNNYVYPELSIKSITIPTAGEGYTGELPVTIIGENLKGHAITCSDASFSNVTYASDTKVTATIKCNGEPVETPVTVNCAEASGTATLKVLKTEECYTDADIGKIVLEDGSLVVKDDYDRNTMKAIAVVVGTKYAGAQVLGVGLQQASSLMWAPSGTTGYKTKFENIICTPSETGSGAASTATFTGDIDGSDNWAYICSIDPEGTKDAATNYPAFDYANNYGVTQGITGNYKDGWYIPSLKELCDIYKVKDKVKDVITAVGGNLRMSSWYWSSSQLASSSSYAYKVDFSDGYVGSYSYKSNNLDVLVLQAFNAE